MRIPFSRFLYVGGNSENREKNTNSPDAASPSKVIRNVLFVFLAEAVGLSFTKNRFQSVEDAAEMVLNDEAKIVTSRPTSEAVSFPENFEPSGNLTNTDALYVQDSFILIPMVSCF